MNYIYDILANFNNTYYDFYDWDDNDDIINIKKLPILKVNSNFLMNIKYHDVLVDSNLLENIYRKTEIFKINKNKYSYVCSLCDSREAIIVRFDSKGNVVGRSSMLIDEENEVVDIAQYMDESNYSITVNKKVLYDNFKTRKELSINNVILKELKKMNSDKLKYLYFDCFNENENNTKKIMNRIITEIKDNFDSIYIKIYDFLKLTSINK